jgi:polyisoprenoid-binding protein YceI
MMMSIRSWMKPLLVLGAVAFSLPAQAAQYRVDMTKSSLSFAGAHADKPFTGTFGVWSANIEFDPKALDKSRIDVTVDVASAKTGKSMYDGTLPTADWFDVKQYPSARFVSSAIRTKEGGGYTAEGTLELRGKSVPVHFDFTLTPADLAAAEVSSSFTLTLNRMDFDIGAKSDAKAEWVSRDITLEVKLVAKAVQG